MRRVVRSSRGSNRGASPAQGSSRTYRSTGSDRRRRTPTSAAASSPAANRNRWYTSSATTSTSSCGGGITSSVGAAPTSSRRSGSGTPESCTRRRPVCLRRGPPRLARSSDSTTRPSSSDRHDPDLQSVIAKHLERKEVRRLLDDHDVARVRSRPCTTSPAPASCRWSRTVAPRITGTPYASREVLAERDAVITIAPFGAVLQELGRVVELHLGGASDVVDAAGSRCSAGRHRGRSRRPERQPAETESSTPV